MHTHDFDDVGVVRLSPGLKCLPRGTGGAILVTRAGRYVRVGNSTWNFVQFLSGEPDGLTVLRAVQAFPRVDLDSLVSCEVIDYQPPFDGRPDALLAGQLWRRNVYWRARLRRRGWLAFEPLLHTALADADVPVCRPSVLDRVEAAARLSLAIPGTSAQCTVVSAAIHDCLHNLGFPVRVVLLGSADQFIFHARAYVGEHPIDPADALLDLEPLSLLSQLKFDTPD